MNCKECAKLLMRLPVERTSSGEGYKPYPVRTYRCGEIGRDIMGLDGDCPHFKERKT